MTNEVAADDTSDRNLGKIEKVDETIRVSISPHRFITLLEEILGDKEKLRWTKEYAFVAHPKDLAQFHHLLLEKLQTQTRATLSLFSAELGYSDDTNRTVTTFAAFERLYEHNEVEANAISMRWEVLVDLGTDRPLQRQVVQLDFATSAAHESRFVSTATIRIEHTHPLWAGEVMTIFRRQVERLAVEYSDLYRALNWYSRYLRTALLALATLTMLVLAAFYFGSGQARKDYWSGTEQFVYELMTTVAKAEDAKKSETLAQFSFILYVFSHPNSSVTEDLIGALRRQKYFSPEIQEVFIRAGQGEFREPIILNSNLRQAFVGSFALLAFLVPFSFFVSMYLKWFRSPAFILLTDRSTQVHTRFVESRSRSREIIFHVVAVAIASLSGKAATYILERGAVVLGG